MSNTTIAAPVATSFDYKGFGIQIADILDNSKDMHKLCQIAYSAIQAGAQYKELSASIASGLKTKRNSTVKTIAVGTLTNRVAAWAFIADNGLPNTADTVGDVYTIVSKSTGRAELPTILTEWNALPKSKQNGPALLAILKSANDRAKVTNGKPKGTTTKPVQSTESPKVITKTDMTADQYMALIRAGVSKSWTAAEKSAIKAVLTAAVAAL